MWIAGTDGKPVTFTNGKWSSNASADIKRLGNAMIETRAGRETLQNMMNTDYPITVEIDRVNTPNKLGVTNNHWKESDGKITITKSEIILYEKIIQKQVDIYNLANQPGYSIVNPTEKDRMLEVSNPTLEQRLGQVGVHEGTHATNRDAMPIFAGENPAENIAVQKEIESIKQTNVEPIPAPIIKIR